MTPTARGAWLAPAAGVALTGVVLALQVRFQQHAGALWRDEVNSVNVAVLPTFGDVLAHSHLDSFPAAWTAVLHGWIRLGLGNGDAELRRLGFLIAVAAIAVVWWAARRLGAGAPLVTLLLLGMSPTAVVYGGQVRGYGLGALAVAWCMAAVWGFVQRPSPWRWLVAAGAAVAAAQTYFGNAFLVLALCTAGAACAIRRGAWPAVLATGAIGGVAALSMLVNLPSVRYAMALSPIEQGRYSLAWLASVLAGALAPEVPVLACAWAIAFVAAAAGWIAAWRDRAGPAVDRERALFAAVAVSVGAAAYYGYLAFIKVRTAYWYYLPLMTLLALAFEVGVVLLSRRIRHGALARTALVAALAALAYPPAARAVAMRMTNVDVIAGTVERLARPDDLVVVMPWYCGITFQRYYDGPAPWITLPDFDEHRFHLHAEVAEKMKRGDAGVADELARVARTLASGNRVWVVGAPVAPKPGEDLPALPLAPHGPEGWRAAPYLYQWERRLGALLRDRGHAISGIALPDLGAVNVAEALPLVLVEG